MFYIVKTFVVLDNIYILNEFCSFEIHIQRIMKKMIKQNYFQL